MLCSFIAENLCSERGDFSFAELSLMRLEALLRGQDLGSIWFHDRIGRRGLRKVKEFSLEAGLRAAASTEQVSCFRSGGDTKSKSKNWVQPTCGP